MVFAVEKAVRARRTNRRARGSYRTVSNSATEPSGTWPARATTLPRAVETSDRRMADLQLHFFLPEAAKHLAPSQIDELVQAMVSCTWNGAYSKVEGVRSKLGVISLPTPAHNLTAPMSFSKSAFPLIKESRPSRKFNRSGTRCKNSYSGRFHPWIDHRFRACTCL